MADITAYKPFYSVLVLAFFCSLMVAGAAVGLRPLQEENKKLDRRKNILLAANLYDENRPVQEQFTGIDTRLIELESGSFVAPDTLSPEDYDQLKAAMSTDMGKTIARENDVAGIRRLEKYSLVYLAMKDSKLEQVILPIRGKGLWSTMYGYISVKDDFTTINGISFYEHGETPGLGGEIENPRWQAGWQDKKIYNRKYDEVIQVGGKGERQEEVHQVDGLSGATITTNGVDNLMTFWFGENGFKPFLTRLKENGGKLNG